jgi:Uma2 family endonuclease
VIAPGYYVDTQEPITTHDSEPEPDVAVIRGARRDFADRHPGPEDVVLVVEVADDSLERDRLEARLYADASIAVFWIVNLRTQTVEIYGRPSGARYEDRRDYTSGAIPVVIDGSEVARVPVEALLP